MIDLLAGLLQACIIDRTGRINTSIVHPRIRQGSHFPEFVVAWKDETDLGKDIVITENDVKNLIMSKASVLGACITLMNQAGISRHDIARVYFSGAFGNYLYKENAIIIGLLPEVSLDRITGIGNGSITGANIALLNRRKRKVLDEIARTIAYVELNAESSFMDEYTRAVSYRTPISRSFPWWRNCSMSAVSGGGDDQPCPRCFLRLTASPPGSEPSPIPIRARHATKCWPSFRRFPTSPPFPPGE